MLINKLKVLKESELRDKFQFTFYQLNRIKMEINMIKRNHYIITFYNSYCFDHLLIKLSFDI
jgi:hypothetical protein